MTARPPKTPDKAPGTANGTSIVSAQWQGPLPPPGALEQFDRIIPNGAERIVGAILILACLGAAIWSIHIGADWKVTLGFLSVPVMGAAAKLFERGARKP